MMKMNKMIASLLCAGALATVSALADDAVVPQGNAENGTAVTQLKQDKAAVKADRKQLRSDKKKLKEDRTKLHKGRKHKKSEKKENVEQPKS